MNWLVYHIVSGQAFFTGILLIIIAALTLGRSRRAARRAGTLALVLGLIAVAVSSTPIPYWYYGLAAAVTLGGGLALKSEKWRERMRYVVIAVWLGAAAIELPYHVTPTLQPVSERAIAIIGDSVSAGIGGDETSVTWPNLLGRNHDLHVQDFSHMGETAASALRRVGDRRITAPVIVVEIGGNDLLGSTSAAQFSHDLDALLAHLAGPQRQIVMFELPLPPFHHEYGRIQREAAARHGAALIPKRVFLSVLAGNDATLDSIHLSQRGHRRMADEVWAIVAPAYAAAENNAD